MTRPRFGLFAPASAIAVAVAALLALVTPGANAAHHGKKGGFETIFDGKTLDGWDGDPKHWSVVDGIIRGDSTKNKARGNTFLIFRKGGDLRNFELKVDYRIHTGNNSGVQYRSKEVSKWVVSGYQSEVQNLAGKTGFLYHEKGRGWLVDVGDFMHISKDGKKKVIGIGADRDTIIKAPYHTDKQWNSYHFVVRGNHVVHNLNGYLTVELIDEHVDAKNPDSLKQQRKSGVIALQVHGGSPMTVDFRNIQLKKLPDHFGDAKVLFNGKDLSGWKGLDADAAKRFSVVDFKHNGKSFKRRGTNDVSIGGALRSSDEGKSGLAYDKPLPKSFVLRYQVNDGGSGEGGAFKPVLGWRLEEMHVHDGKVNYIVKGSAATGGAITYRDGKVVIPAGLGAMFRNVVLLPIN